MKQETIIQHYVPQFYLRNFSSQGKSICVYDKKEDHIWRNALIHGQAQGKRFYDLDPDEILKDMEKDDRRKFLADMGKNYDDLKEKRQEIEREYNTSFEIPAAQIIHKIIDKAERYRNNPWRMSNCTAITEEEKHILSMYIALQYVRTPYCRAVCKEIMENAILQYNKILFHYDPPTEEEILRLEKENPEIRGKIRGKEGILNIENKYPDIWDHMTCEVDPRVIKIQQLQLMTDLDAIQKIAMCLEGRKWSFVLNNSTVKYYTSDNPVCLYNPYSEPESIWGDGRLAGSHVGILFPISPDIIISMNWKRKDSLFLSKSCADDLGFEQGTEPLVDRANKLQIYDSLRFIYASNDDFSTAQKECKKHQELRNGTIALKFNNT